GRTVQRRYAFEGLGTVKPRQQLRGSPAPILIEHRIGHAVQVERRGIAEKQRLQDRRHEKDDPAARILEDGEQFLADEREDATKRSGHRKPHASLFRVAARATARRTTAIAASTAALDRMTVQMLPARKM